MENHSHFNTISQQMIDNHTKRKEKLEKRLDDIEEWLLENPFTHPEFGKKVEERNNILTTIEIIKNGN